MAKKRTVVKVSIGTKKCQQEVLKAVSKIPGIVKLEMDVNKGTLTVVGEVEPVPIFKALKKIGASPEIVSVGPPKSDRCGPYCNCNFCRPYSDTGTHTGNHSSRDAYGSYQPYCNMPCCCRQCQLVAVDYLPDPGGQCSIM